MMTSEVWTVILVLLGVVGLLLITGVDLWLASVFGVAVTAAAYYVIFVVGTPEKRPR